MKIVMITGTLGSGKTTLLVNLLRWMRSTGKKLPPVIVNDRGEGSNLDFARVTGEIGGLDATDLLGQCIGCGARDEFLTIVRDLRDRGEKMLVIEPTGLFTLSELEGIAHELSRCEIGAIHLIALPEAQASVEAGFNNLRHCKVIGITHAERDASAEMGLISGITGKPVMILEESPSADQIAEIWGQLVNDDHHDCGHGHSHEHHGHDCGHEHHHHEHHHHHPDEPHVVTFSTEKWSMSGLVSYLVGLGDDLVRFKGVIETDDGLVRLEWAHSRWSQSPVQQGAVLKADLFTKRKVDPCSREVTDENIETLVKGVPPVIVESPNGDFAILDAVGPSAWSLLYEMSEGASPAVRNTCGLRLTDRCCEAARELLEGNLERFNPNLLDYSRLQTAMVWLWWNEEFGFELSSADREDISNLLSVINPEGVNREALRPWMGARYRYLPRLMEQFPEHATLIKRVQKRMTS